MKLEDTIIKYPRTPHIQGSRLQPGDEDLRQRPFSDIAGRNVVLEEKIDGANSAVSFTDDGAHVSIVYLETDWQTLLERNRSREDAVPKSVIEEMMGKMTLPEASEARKVIWRSVKFDRNLVTFRSIMTSMFK